MTASTPGRPTGRYDLPDLVTLEAGGRTASSLSERAYYLIRDRLVTVDIPPGATVDERRLQTELGMGRTPVREALRQLAHDRFITVAPHRGMFASHVDMGDLRSICEVRTELEGHAGHLAAQRAGDRDITEIDALLSELYTRKPAAGRRELLRIDRRIHGLVHRITGNRYLAATLQKYYLHSLRMWFLVLDDIPEVGDAVGEHLELLAAVRDGDTGTARSILRGHVLAFEARLRTVL